MALSTSDSADIANLALSALGQGVEIQDLETENTAAARAVRRVYNLCREQTLRDFSWPFATKRVLLELTAATDPEWRYAYRYPADCLFFRRILSGVRNETRQSRIPNKIIADDNGRLVLTDQENAWCEYTFLVENETFYPPDFRSAFALRIASAIAPRLTGGDPFKLGDRALRNYSFEISMAQANAGNEEQPEEEPQSEFIRGRD